MHISGNQPGPFSKSLPSYYHRQSRFVPAQKLGNFKSKAELEKEQEDAAQRQAKEKEADRKRQEAARHLAQGEQDLFEDEEDDEDDEDDEEDSEDDGTEDEYQQTFQFPHASSPQNDFFTGNTADNAIELDSD